MSKSGFVATVALSVSLWASTAQSQQVEFTALLASENSPSAPPDAWRLARAKVFEVFAGVRATQPFYAEDLGYLYSNRGQVKIRLGGRDVSAFRSAFKLDAHPDEVMFNRPLVATIELCAFVLRQAGQPDRCDEARANAWELQQPEVALDAAPIAQTVARVPLSALPPEVVLQTELDAAVEAEAQARAKAVAAVQANLDLETARARAAEAALRNDLNAVAAARQQAMDAERQARAAADLALSAELSAERQARIAADAALGNALSAEVASRVDLQNGLAGSDRASYPVHVNHLRGLPVCSANSALSSTSGAGGDLSCIELPRVNGRACPAGQFVTGFSATGDPQCGAARTSTTFYRRIMAEGRQCDVASSMRVFAECPQGMVSIGCSAYSTGDHGPGEVSTVYEDSIMGTINWGDACEAIGNVAPLVPYRCVTIYSQATCAGTL